MANNRNESSVMLGASGSRLKNERYIVPIDKLSQQKALFGVTKMNPSQPRSAHKLLKYIDSDSCER